MSRLTGARRTISRMGLCVFAVIATFLSVFAQTGAQTRKPAISKARTGAAPTPRAANPGAAATPSKFDPIEYAAKFVCGVPGVEAQREAVKPGNYATAINIHNPNQLPTTPPISFTKHAVLAVEEDLHPLPPFPPVTESLPSDFAMEVDCTNIAKLLGGTTAPFFKGWLIILTASPLDVVGVYTSEPPPSAPGGPPAGMGLEVLPIAPRTVTK